MKNHIRSSIGFIINYLIVLGLSLIFALFMSARIGWFLMAAFILAPFISAVSAYIQSKRISIRTESGHIVLSKGSHTTIRVTIENFSFLPTPGVFVTMHDSPAVRCKEQKFFVSLLPNDTCVLEAEYTAVMWGGREIAPAEAYVSDHLGLFSFKIHVETDEKIIISVIPDIIDYPEGCNVVRSAQDISTMYDDSEETKESGISSVSGLPGFDCREYVPGDPIKRINWKQSAKRDVLLVRMDDEIPCSCIKVILDSVYRSDKVNLSKIPLPEPPKMEPERGLKRWISFLMSKPLPVYMPSAEEIEVALMKNAQSAVETTLSVIRELLLRNFGVQFMVWGEYGWETYEIFDETDLSGVQLAMADYSFRPHQSDTRRFPEDELSDGKRISSVIFSTPCLDASLGSVIKSGKYANVTILNAAEAVDFTE
ncbi:MAG: DUF58 domain-containing protein [Huintestinicola sp.]